MPTPFGPGCWQFFFVSEPAHNEVKSRLDSNDSRMQQVVFADDKVWGALDTIVRVDDKKKAGIAFFVVRPAVHDGGDSVTGNLVKQGYVAAVDNNVTYPAVAVLPNGKGIMAFTLVGKDFYPSAAYATIDAKKGAGDIHIAAAGRGPDDGFTSYKSFVGDPPRTRWGDYGAAVTDGNKVWLASEYIGQTCTFAEYLANTPDSPLFSCGRTRTSLANWYTRISAVKP